LGTAALVCGLLPIPLIGIAGVVLACIVLTRGRARAGRGRGRAIGALVACGTWLLVGAALLVVMGVARAHSPSDGRVGTIRATDVRVGDCLTMPPVGRTTRVTLVPCSASHDAEVYAQFSLGAGPYPGDSIVSTRAWEGCFIRLDDFVGPGALHDQLAVNYLLPLEESWPSSPVSCIVGTKGGRTTGSLRYGAATNQAERVGAAPLT
jgi:hypothetical protein